MPKARPPLEPVTPFPLSKWEVLFIKETVGRFYGNGATIRNFGPDPLRIEIHVETDRAVVRMERYDCLGVLMTKIERPIGLTVSKRGNRIGGYAKIAYRQGVVI